MSKRHACEAFILGNCPYDESVCECSHDPMILLYFRDPADAPPVQPAPNPLVAQLANRMDRAPDDAVPVVNVVPARHNRSPPRRQHNDGAMANNNAPNMVGPALPNRQPRDQAPRVANQAAVLGPRAVDASLIQADRAVQVAHPVANQGGKYPIRGANQNIAAVGDAPGARGVRFQNANERNVMAPPPRPDVQEGNQGRRAASRGHAAYPQARSRSGAKEDRGFRQGGAQVGSPIVNQDGRQPIGANQNSAAVGDAPGARGVRFQDANERNALAPPPRQNVGKQQHRSASVGGARLFNNARAASPQQAHRSRSAAPNRGGEVVYRQYELPNDANSSRREIIVIDTCALMNMTLNQLQTLTLRLNKIELAIPVKVFDELDYQNKNGSPEQRAKAKIAREWVGQMQEAGFVRCQQRKEVDAAVRATANCNDDHILAFAVYLKEQEANGQKRPLTLLTDDRMFGLKIRAEGVPVYDIKEFFGL